MARLCAAQHVLFFFGWLLDALIPDVPEEIEVKIKRQKYLAKQALLGVSLWARAYQQRETRDAIQFPI